MIEELFSLASRRALVTGGGRGLGRAIAVGLAACGADVAVLARSEEEVEAAAREIEARGRRSLALRADVARSSEVEDALDRVAAAWGGLDVLVNNAGTNVRKPTLETTDEDWRHVLRTNLDAAFFCSRGALRLMAGRGGRIINIGSVAGEVAIPTGVAYAASKGGLSQMTRSLAQEFGGHGVNVNCIAPWYFETPLTRDLLRDPSYRERVLDETPIRRVGRDADIVGLAVFLAGPASAWITGQTIALDGGMSIARFRPPRRDAEE